MNLKRIILLFVLTMNIVPTSAENILEVYLHNNINNLNLTGVTASYRTSSNFPCGVMDDGTNVGRKKMVSYDIDSNGYLKIDKSIKSKFICPYVLDEIHLNSKLGQYWEYTLLSINVLNRYNRDVYYDPPLLISNEFDFSCSAIVESPDEFECSYIHAAVDLNESWIDIFIN